MRNQASNPSQRGAAPEAEGWTGGLVSWAAPIIVPVLLFLLYRLILSDIGAEIIG
ncbi:MAG: hypothetical protein LBU23_12865 [Planctomycetota bacterium]|jgi:hypothetical protein|nr:hypothetical protein [Planctomycetota bacterium]